MVILSHYCYLGLVVLETAHSAFVARTGLLMLG